MLSALKTSAILAVLLLATSLAQAQFISSGVTVSSATSVTLNWATAQPTTGIVQWGTTIGFGRAATSDDGTMPLSKVHSVTISGLTPSTSYRWRVIATDLFGEIAIGNYLTFSTTAAAQHAVALTWTDSLGGLGFNVYRGPTTGGPYIKLTPTPIPATVYTDPNVTTGQTYYYVTTAVSLIDSQESAASNEVKVLITP